MAPLIAPFLAAHPRVQVDLWLNDHVINMIDENIDLSIRIGDLHDSTLIAIPLGHVMRAVCASRRYWRKHRKPKHPQDLKDHHCIAFRGLEQERGWLFRVHDEEKLWPIPSAYICNDGAAILSVAREGGGVVQMMSYQVAADLKQKQLETALDEVAPYALPVHVVYPSGKLLPAKVRAALDEWVPKLRKTLLQIQHMQNHQ